MACFVASSVTRQASVSDFTKTSSQRTHHGSVTSVILEAACLQGTGGTCVGLHVFHWWALGHIGGRGFLRVVKAAAGVMVAVHGGVHSCSIAAGQSTVVLQQRNLRNVTSAELRKGKSIQCWVVISYDMIAWYYKNSKLLANSSLWNCTIA